jgi:hypothetical protein
LEFREGEIEESRRLAKSGKSVFSKGSNVKDFGRL